MRVFSLIIAVVIVSLQPGGATAGKFNAMLSIGDVAPEWGELVGTDGRPHSLASYRSARLVVLAFIANHCPVAEAYEQRIVRFTKEYKHKEVAVVAISCSLIETDGPRHMKERALERNFRFDYLHDASQKSGKAYGANVTPFLFVLDQERKIAYMGAFDDNVNEPEIEEHYVIDAVNSLLKR